MAPRKKAASRDVANSRIASGFALQLLKSPKKKRNPSDPASLELEDAIEVSSDEEPRSQSNQTQSRKRTQSQAFGHPGGRAVKSEALVLVPGEASSDKEIKNDSGSSRIDPEHEKITWLDRVHLTKTSDLCVHKKKVEDVAGWIKSAFSRIAENTVLILSGPAGAGKTATVETLAVELDFDLVEWRNPMSWTDTFNDQDRDGLAQQFERFLSISDKYSSLDFGEGLVHRGDRTRRKVVLVEDIPNTFTSSRGISTAKAAFQTSIKRYLTSPRNKFPMILIITETEPRGDDIDWFRSDAMNIRNLFSRDILDSQNCKQIEFNPVAPTFISKALNRLIDSLPRGESVDISPAVIDEISQTANGDIRSAINSLEFISHRFRRSPGHHRPLPGRRKRKRGEILSLTADETRILNTITNREAALGYFHALGKLLYNKPTSHAATTTRTTSLPAHLASYNRPEPDSDAFAILEETSTDGLTFLMGCHQNYLDSTDTLEQAAHAIDALSRVDAETGGFASWSGPLWTCVAASGVMEVQVHLARPTRRPLSSRLYFPQVGPLRNQYAQIDGALESYIGPHRRMPKQVAVSDVVPYDDLIRGRCGIPRDATMTVASIKRHSTLGRGGVHEKKKVLDEDSDEDGPKAGPGKAGIKTAIALDEDVDDEIEEIE